MNISIGICLKNEQHTIIELLNSMIKSLSICTPEYNFKIFICLNGSTDQSKSLIEVWQAKNTEHLVHLIILPKGNLIEAQRAIITASKKSGCTVDIFLDADIIIDEMCVSELLLTAKENPIAKAIYATSVPIHNNKTSLIEKALNQYDVSPTIYSPRKHLHGRAFLIRDWNIPKTDPRLLVDDIYLSFYLLQNYGPNSIISCVDAKVYFYQVKTLNDLHKASVRRTLELRKCIMLFPEFKKIPEDMVNRKISFVKMLKESPQRQFLWLYLIGAKKTLSYLYKIRTFLNPDKYYFDWKPTTTSKKTRSQPVLVLIEGLDCSGKKTVAKIVHNDLLEKGISNQINIGPLGNNFYHSISRIVSANNVPNFIRSLVYSFEGFTDTRNIKKFSTDVVIQISSPYRSWAYAEAHKIKLRYLLAKTFSHRFIKYNQIWLLTCPYDLRIKRHTSQAAKNQNKDSIEKRFPGKQIFKQIEILLEQNILGKQKINKIFDTSNTHVEQVASEILINIYRDLGLK